MSSIIANDAPNQALEARSEAIASYDTTCPYCGVGCGIEAKVKQQEVISVKGREQHPANYGRLCVKGSAVHETLSPENRLLKPRIRNQETSWDNALDYVAERWKSIIDEHGPDAVAFYLSAQLLTEDYYVANKLMKGFIGTANIDTNSRLCMASAVVAHKRAFGGDIVPACYEDLEKTDALFIVGSNTAYAHPILFQRISAAKKQRKFPVVVIDPRKTATCEIADLHIPLRPGADAYFFNGLLSYLADQNKINHDYISAHCDGYETTLAAAKAQVPSLSVAAEFCDVDATLLKQAYDLFANTENVVTLFSMGINQSSSGVDKGNAIINCHLATGKIGREGAAPFSITGQPNAMGGREVGGLANQFVAHMGFTPEAIEMVETFWQAPNIAKKDGLKAVDMFEAVHSGKIKAIWIMATNPVVSMPDADRVKEALERCDLVVVSDFMANTDTAATADVLLPATSWSEKHGMVTNSERCISLQRGFMKPAGEAKNDWQIMCAFAAKLGYQDAFNYSHPIEIFREHAALSGLNNDSEDKNSRAFNISALSDISFDDYQQFKPTRWPITQDRPNGQDRMFEDGRFFTPNKRAQLIPITARLPQVAAKPQQLIMNTGRIRDQWHTMTRTGKAAKLASHSPEPYVSINPNDAKRYHIGEGGLIRLSNRNAQFIGRVDINASQKQGEVFVPMHWTQVYASSARVGALINPVTDPFSGQPEFKQSPVTASAYNAAWHGLLVTTKEVSPNSDYWAKITEDRGYQYQLADQSTPACWEDWLNAHFSDIDDWVSLEDSSGIDARYAGFSRGKLEVAFIVATTSSELPGAQWLASQLGSPLDTESRFLVLAGQSGDASLDPGTMICSCYQVGENAIIQSVKEGCSSPEALGAKLKCGTNCGSCIPELSALINEHSETTSPEYTELVS